MSEETINLIMSEVEPIQVVKYIHPALRPDPPDFIIPSMKIKYEPNVSLPCSIGLEEFYADVEIEYYPHDYLLEFMSFEDWLADEVAPKAMTIEDLALLLFRTLRVVLGDIQLRIQVSATTTVHAPVSVSISTRSFFNE